MSWWWDEEWDRARVGSTRLRVHWDGGEALATAFDEGAPETTAAVVRALPLEVPVVHVAWSGEMLMGARRFELGASREENRTRLPRVGDLTWDPKYGELGFVYGTAECRLPSGANTVVVYGTVTDGLEDFAQFCRARRFEGAGAVSLELA